MSRADMPLNIDEVLDNLPFPASKVQILTYAGNHNACPALLKALQNLPVRQYGNLHEICDCLELIEVQPSHDNYWTRSKMP